MLVSVTERTREIGIRKSLGADKGTILQQFVIEAAVTSSLGGLVGIIDRLCCHKGSRSHDRDLCIPYVGGSARSPLECQWRLACSLDICRQDGQRT